MLTQYSKTKAITLACTGLATTLACGAGQALAESYTTIKTDSERFSVIAIYDDKGNGKYNCRITYWVPIIGSDHSTWGFLCARDRLGRGDLTKLRVGSHSQSGDWPPAYFDTSLKQQLNNVNVLTVPPRYNDQGRVRSLVYNLDERGNMPALRPSNERGRKPRWLCMDKETWEKRDGNGVATSEYTAFRILTYSNGTPITSANKQGCQKVRQGMSQPEPLKPRKPGLNQIQPIK